MKRLFSIFIICACIAPCLALGAVSVKKAAPVATKQADKMESATSLLPSVIGLVGSVRQLNAQQQQLTAECAPTSDEIETVNDLVKEWAKIGDASASSFTGVTDCGKSGFQTYKNFMEQAEGNEVCYSFFNGGYVWDGFPKAEKAEICPDDNKKNCKTVSNVYEVFGKITFSDKDYTKREAEKVAKLKDKYAKCAPAQVNAAKRELYGNFLTGTLSGIGQTTGAAETGSVINAVTSMGGGSNIGSMLPSLGQMATQVLDR